MSHKGHWLSNLQPIYLGRQAYTTIPFDLSQPSTNTTLSIFSAESQLVWYGYLGLRAAHAYKEMWDGRNDAGELVGSGSSIIC